MVIRNCALHVIQAEGPHAADPQSLVFVSYAILLNASAAARNRMTGQSPVPGNLSGRRQDCRYAASRSSWDNHRIASLGFPAVFRR